MENSRPKRNGNGTDSARQILVTGFGVGLAIVLHDGLLGRTHLSEPIATGLAWFAGFFAGSLGLNVWYRYWFCGKPITGRTVLEWLGDSLLIGIVVGFITWGLKRLGI